MRWTNKDWWSYLLGKPLTLKAFFCRASGHKCGVVWYNTTGMEPDMTCKGCGDDLG